MEQTMAKEAPRPLLAVGDGWLAVVEMSLAASHGRLKAGGIVVEHVLFLLLVKGRILPKPSCVNAIAQLPVADAIGHLDGDVVVLLRVEALDQVVPTLDLAGLDDGTEELEGDLVLLFVVNVMWLVSNLTQVHYYIHKMSKSSL